MAMGKDPMMGEELWSNGYYVKKNLIHKVESYKMLWRLWQFYVNSCFLDLSRHILVSMKPLHITFWHVKIEDVDKISHLYICDPIKGTMKIHSIYVINKTNFT